MIYIHPQYQSIREELLSIPQRFAHEGDIIYDSRNQIRIMTLSDGTEVSLSVIIPLTD